MGLQIELGYACVVHEISSWMERYLHKTRDRAWGNPGIKYIKNNANVKSSKEEKQCYPFGMLFP